MNTKQTLLMAFVIALVCAGLVYYLERFQADMMISKWHEYLRKNDALDAWEQEHPSGD